MAKKKVGPTGGQTEQAGEPAFDATGVLTDVESKRPAPRRLTPEIVPEGGDAWARLDTGIKERQEALREYRESEDAGRVWAALIEADVQESDATHVEERGRAASLGEVRDGRRATEDARLIRERVARGEPLLDFKGTASLGTLPESDAAPVDAKPVSNELNHREVRIEPPADSWQETAQEMARSIICRDQSRGHYPPQLLIADEIAGKFRDQSIVGQSGVPLTGTYIKRHALKGISVSKPKPRRTKTS